MASDINTVTLTGRVVADPEGRKGGAVAAFGVAMNRSVRQEDGSADERIHALIDSYVETSRTEKGQSSEGAR